MLQADLIDEAEPMIEGFAALVTGHTSRSEPDIDALETTVVKLAGMSIEMFPGASNGERQRAREKAQEQCLAGYVAKRLSQRFPMIDADLLNRRRWVGIDFGEGDVATVANTRTVAPGSQPRTGDRRYVQGPLLMEYTLSEYGRGHRDRGVLFGRIPWPRRTRTDCQVYANFPGAILPQQMRFADAAQAEFYRAKADLLSVVALAPLARSHIPEPQLAALWIPTLSSFYTREQARADRRDPALVIKAFGAAFLCCLWDCQDEEPVEALLREFSIGGTVNRA